MPSEPSSRAAFAAPLLLALLLSGCGPIQDAPAGSPGSGPAGAGAVGGPDTCSPETAKQHVIAVVGTHANMPRPVLVSSERPASSKALDCALDHLLREGGELTMVSVDGAPTLTRQNLPSLWESVHPKADESVIRQHLNAERRKLAASLQPTAETEGADLHRALDLALRSASDAPEDSVVLVLDNGLTDRGVVNFTREGWTQATPQDLVDSVARTGQLLHASPGTPVFLSGLGQTAPPQETLSIHQERVIASTWETLLKEAEVETHLETAGWTEGEANPTDLATGVIEPRTVEPKPPGGATPPTPTSGPVLTLDQSVLPFDPDEASISDDSGLAETLEPAVRLLRDEPEAELYVIGRTDSNPTTRWKDNMALSQARAETVKKLLSDQGADPARIVAEGQGYQACPEDGGPGGNEPGLKALNRTVIIGLLKPDGSVPTECLEDGDFPDS